MLSTEEFQARLKEVEDDAKNGGQQIAPEELFHPNSDGQPLEPREREALAQHWNATFLQELARLRQAT